MGVRKSVPQVLVDDEMYLGTSDIIESVFGKYKSFAAKTPIRDIGKTILTIPVLSVEVTTENCLSPSLHFLYF
jgi:hypothetical protein